MFLYRLYITLHNGQLKYIRNPINNILFYLFIIVAVTTIINYYEISLKDYTFTWSQGLNSSKYRSISFIIRLFLVIYSVYYIVNGAKSYTGVDPDMDLNGNNTVRNHTHNSQRAKFPYSPNDIMDLYSNYLKLLS